LPHEEVRAPAGRHQAEGTQHGSPRRLHGPKF